VTGKSIWELIKQTISNWSDIHAPRMGAALAFYTMLSIAPLLVISVSIAGLVFGEQAAEGHIVDQIRGLAGNAGAQVVEELVRNAAKPSTGILAGALGLLTLLFGASGVLSELRDSLNGVWRVKSSSTGLMGLVRSRFVAFALVLGIGFLLMVSLLLSAAISAAGKFFGGFLPVSEVALNLINVAVSFVGVTVLFALLYRVVPDVWIRWQDVWIGAAVTSALFSIGKFAIGLYLGKAVTGSAYGAAGSLVIFLVWVYYSAQIFFLGAEFTHTFAERHGSRATARGAWAPISKVRGFSWRSSPTAGTR